MNEIKNFKVINPVTIPVTKSELKEILTERFKGYIDDVLDCDVLAKLEFSETMLVSAEVRIVAVLTGSTLIQLAHFADSWNQDMSLSGSGAGLKIQFTLKNN